MEVDFTSQPVYTCLPIMRLWHNIHQLYTAYLGSLYYRTGN